jgi:uncharacterized protein
VESNVRTSLLLTALALAGVGCAGHVPVTATAAVCAQSVPHLQGRVTDTAGVLSLTQQSRLSDLLANYEHETHHQLAVLTVKTLAGESLETYSLRVANCWRLGQPGIDNGILITLAVQERKVRIELGKGMQRYISNSEAQSIIDGSMVPAFAEGDFAGGLQQGLERLMADARGFVVP